MIHMIRSVKLLLCLFYFMQKNNTNYNFTLNVGKGSVDY